MTPREKLIEMVARQIYENYSNNLPRIINFDNGCEERLIAIRCATRLIDYLKLEVVDNRTPPKLFDKISIDGGIITSYVTKGSGGDDEVDKCEGLISLSKLKFYKKTLKHKFCEIIQRNNKPVINIDNL